MALLQHPERTTNVRRCEGVQQELQSCHARVRSSLLLLLIFTAKNRRKNWTLSKNKLVAETKAGKFEQ